MTNSSSTFPLTVTLNALRPVLREAILMQDDAQIEAILTILGTAADVSNPTPGEYTRAKRLVAATLFHAAKDLGDGDEALMWIDEELCSILTGLSNYKFIEDVDDAAQNIF